MLTEFEDLPNKNIYSQGQLGNYVDWELFCCYI